MPDPLKNWLFSIILYTFEPILLNLETMKKFLLAAFLFVTATASQAQTTIANFNEKPACWLGIDFTLAKFIGAHGFTEPDQIKSTYFSEWNYLIIREQSRYDIKSAFNLKQDSFLYQIDPVLAANQEIVMDGYIQEKSHSITEQDIQTALSKYDLSAVKQEVGISFFVANFNKNLEEAVIWVVLSDIATKKIFFSRELKTAPTGFGFRNYWAGAIRETILLTSGSLKKWQKGK